MDEMEYQPADREAFLHKYVEPHALATVEPGANPNNPDWVGNGPGDKRRASEPFVGMYDGGEMATRTFTAERLPEEARRARAPHRASPVPFPETTSEHVRCASGDASGLADLQRRSATSRDPREAALLSAEAQICSAELASAYSR